VLYPAELRAHCFFITFFSYWITRVFIITKILNMSFWKIINILPRGFRRSNFMGTTSSVNCRCSNNPTILNYTYRIDTYWNLI